MFRLIKILGAGAHLPEPEKILLRAPVTAKRGTPIAVRDGEAVISFTTAADGAPDHFLMRDADGENEILAAALPDGALFAAPLCAQAAHIPAVGARVTVLPEEGVLDPTQPVATVWGAVVYNTCGAAAGGDELLVIFPNHI